MPTSRILLIVLVVAGCAAVAVALAPAADGPAPVVRLTASITPKQRPIPPRTSLFLHLDTRFKSVPPGGDFVLQSFDYLFPRGAASNAKLFPSCSVATLAKAHGRLGACPQGSQIGSGVATGTAVAIGVTSTGKIALFNGPGGKSITMNVSILRPAVVNTTYSAPLIKVHGRYAFKLSATLPDSLEQIIDGDIVVARIDVTTGGTRVVDGVEHGYIEATHCPLDGKATIHADFGFNQGAKASVDTNVPC